MEDKLIELLEQFGFSVIRQGSLGADEPYPDSFFTFWNNSSEDLSHYDNKSYSYVWDFDLNFYSIDPKNTYNILDEAIKLLKANGFIISGKGHDVISDEPTHTGRGVNVRCREYVIEKGDDYMIVNVTTSTADGIKIDKSYDEIMQAIQNKKMVFVLDNAESEMPLGYIFNARYGDKIYFSRIAMNSTNKLSSYPFDFIVVHQNGEVECRSFNQN